MFDWLASSLSDCLFWFLGKVDGGVGNLLVWLSAGLLSLCVSASLSLCLCLGGHCHHRHHHHHCNHNNLRHIPMRHQHHFHQHHHPHFQYHPGCNQHHHASSSSSLPCLVSTCQGLNEHVSPEC